MELSQLKQQGLSLVAKAMVRISDVFSNTDPAYRRLATVLTQYHTAMRPVVHLAVRLIVRLLDGPAAPALKFGLRLWLGALLLRKGITFLFLLYKLIRRTMTTMLSIGTGSSRSVARRDAWRMTVPVREAGLMPLHAVTFAAFATEQVGAVVVGSSLLTNALFTHDEATPIRLVQRLVISCLTLRPIRIALAHPFEFFVVYPLIYGILKYRSVSTMSRAKVTVTQIVNNYYGGKTEAKSKTFDPLLVAHLALETTGLPWAAQVFLVYRNSILENGWDATWDVAKDHFKSWRHTESWRRTLLRTLFLMATMPLAFAASILAGTRRPAYAPVVRFAPVTPASTSSPPAQALPPTDLTNAPAAPAEIEPIAPAPTLPVVELPRPGLGFEPPPQPRNALVEIYSLPHSIGLELFARGEAALMGGEALPVIAVESDPRLRVTIPTKPVTNNTFAFDILSAIGDHPVATRLRELTKVPANPFRNGVEIQKFVSKHLDVDFDEVGRYCPQMTAGQFILAGLNIAYNLVSTDWIEVGDLKPDADMFTYLNSETRKHHPGWTTRAFGGQTKGDAWPYSIERASRLWNALQAGDASGLRRHVWLFLGVVKKQAERKEFDEEYRSRGAVIPEQELQLIWTHLMKPLGALFESKVASWSGKFELFHGGLERVWRRFEGLRAVHYVNEDIRDHGASLEIPVAELIAQFYGEHVRLKGGRTTRLFRALFEEMILANVGLPLPDGSVQIMKTSRGMKDGVYGTSTIGATFKIIGELWKLWVAWNNNSGAQKVWTDPLQLVTMLVEEVHGDNSLAAYPVQLAAFLSGANPEVARVVARIGLTVKTEETLSSALLSDMSCMSWRMANIGPLTRPAIVGWKPTADSLKAFFLPERIADFDHIGDTTREYLGQILVCMYILGFWNGETRAFCEHTWLLLWSGVHDEQIVELRAVRDFAVKTGLDPEKLDTVSSRSPRPYDPERVVRLWLGREAPRFVNVTAPGAPTLADGARLMLPVARMLESNGIRFSTTTLDLAVVDYDYEGTGAGVFSRPVPPRGGLPGGSRLVHRLTVYEAPWYTVIFDILADSPWAQQLRRWCIWQCVAWRAAIVERVFRTLRALLPWRRALFYRLVHVLRRYLQVDG